MNLRLMPVQVAIGRHHTEGYLVFHDDFLVAVLVRLSDEYEANAGRWHLEATFGRIDAFRPPTFADLDGAQAWIAAHLA